LEIRSTIIETLDETVGLLTENSFTNMLERQGDIIVHDRERIHQLLDASIQIVDHMDESDGLANQLEQIRQLLKAEAGKAARGEAVSESQLAKAEQLTADLEGSAQEDYRNETDGSPASYEALSLDEQRDQAQAYHEKIDFLSLKKVKENLQQLRRLLH